MPGPKAIHHTANEFQDYAAKLRALADRMEYVAKTMVRRRVRHVMIGHSRGFAMGLERGESMADEAIKKIVETYPRRP